MLSQETLKRQIKNVYEEVHNNALPNSVEVRLKKLISEANKNNATSLYKFAQEKTNQKEQKLLKITSANVPANIFPSEYKVVLHDIKVDGHGPDDEIYNTNPDIRQKIPRGLALLEVTGKESWWDVVIYANRKFTGGVGDEDEEQPNSDDLWKEFFISDITTAQNIIGMTKVNGEAGHFSVRFINGELYLISGSKNVHLITRRKEDIDLYVGDRYKVAKVVTRSVWNVLESITKTKRDVMYSFLHHTKTTGVCEILQPDYQHIINLDHLKEPQLYLLSVTPNTSDSDCSSLTALPPHHSVDLFKALGFTCPSYTKISVSELSEHKEKIRCELNKEGEVLYFINDKEDTIGLVKSKTLWYIFSRALREKATYCFGPALKRKSWFLEDYIKGVHKRYDDIEEWLKIKDSCYLNEWKNLAKEFLQWMEKDLKKRNEEINLRPEFPRHWTRFLKETNNTDNIPLKR